MNRRLLGGSARRRLALFSPGRAGAADAQQSRTGRADRFRQPRGFARRPVRGVPQRQGRRHSQQLYPPLAFGRSRQRARSRHWKRGRPHLSRPWFGGTRTTPFQRRSRDRISGSGRWSSRSLAGGCYRRHYRSAGRDRCRRRGLFSERRPKVTIVQGRPVARRNPAFRTVGI